MSQEKNLRSQIREIVRSVIKEENFISRYLRNMAKRIEKREFDRIMSKSPALKRDIQNIIKKADEKVTKQITQRQKDFIKDLVKMGKADPKDPKIAKYLK